MAGQGWPGLAKAGHGKPWPAVAGLAGHGHFSNAKDLERGDEYPLAASPDAALEATV